MYMALHARNDIDRLYVSRKEGRGFANIEDSDDAYIQLLEDYIKEEPKSSNYSDQK